MGSYVQINIQIRQGREVIAKTKGINDIGLTVKNLQQSRDFFVDLLGWTESGYDSADPRTAVSDGSVRLTLWELDHFQTVSEFNRRTNAGLRHLALEVESERMLVELHNQASTYPGVKIEFAPEFVGSWSTKAHDVL